MIRFVHDVLEIVFVLRRSICTDNMYTLEGINFTVFSLSTYRLLS